MGFEIISITATACVLPVSGSPELQPSRVCTWHTIDISKCQRLSHCGRCNTSVLVDMPKSPTFVLTWSNLVLKMLNLKKTVRCIKNDENSHIYEQR